MSIGAAIDFLARVQADEEFRRGCYRCADREELAALLHSCGYRFDELEFDNAVNHLVLRCESESQAYVVHHLESWYRVLSSK